MNILEVVNDAHRIAKIEKLRSKRNYFITFLDIIYSRYRYGAIPCDYLAFGFAMLKYKQRNEFLTSHHLISLVNLVNNRKMDSKWLSYKMLKKYYKRDVINILDNTPKEIDEFLNKHNVFFAKSLEGTGGYGVKRYVIDKNPSYEYIQELLKELKDKKLIMLEEEIKQHDDISALNPTSVNTLRILSVRNNKDEIIFLPSVLRVGGGDSYIDNVSSGGMYTLIDSDGKIGLDGYYQENLDKNQNGLIVKNHPKTGINPLGLKIPYIEEAYDLVREMSKELRELRIIGWDIAICKDGIDVLEYNAFPGLDMNQNYYFSNFMPLENIGGKYKILKHLGLKEEDYLRKNAKK